MFIGVFAVTLQGLSKNGRGSREAGGEVAPFYVAKWHGAVHWYKFRNLIRRLRRHLLPFLEKALNARHFVKSNPPINQNLNALVYLDNLILRCYNTDLDSGAGRPKKEAGEKPARARRRMLKIRKADAPTARCDTIGAIREGAARVSTSRKTCHADPP